MTETATAAAADTYTQALKALSERCPLDTEEFSSRVPTLPAGVAAHLSRQSDGRRKFKKSSHGEPAVNPPGRPPAGSNVWQETEDFFRPITPADIDSLVPKLSFSDSCFCIPIIETSSEKVKKDVSFNDSEVEVSLNSVPVVEVEEKKVEEHAMEIDSVGTSGTNTVPSQEEEEEEESSFMNWVLGSKHRVMLTTQRPTKKRKLLGGDAGLDRLLLLPHSPECSPLCDFCCLGESGVKSNRLISCDSCSVSVHWKCYGTHEALEGPWLCSWCKHLEAVGGRGLEREGEDSGMRPCLLCPKEGGALKAVGGSTNGDGGRKFAHLFCSLWAAEVYVEDTGAMEPVMNVGGVQEMRTKLVCYLCKVKHGACVRCSHGTCRTAFHPICAREAKHQMEIWGKFGCDNVELRAFCVKHSTFGSAQHSKNLTRTVGDDFSVAKPLPVALLTNKLPKLRLRHKNKDKSMIQAEMTNSVSNEVVKNETTLEQDDALALRLNPEGGDVQSNKNMDNGVIGSGNSLPHASKLILVFKKLISRGKINVGDVASEIGISSDSLEGALMGEISSFPSELRLKIIKWLQDSIHMPASMRHLKFRNGSAISSGSLAARVDCPNATDVTGPYVPGHSKVADPDDADACSVKSLPPRRRTKNNIRILKEDKTMHSSGEKIQQSCNGELVDEIGEVPVVHVEYMKADAIGNMSPIHYQGSCYKDQVLLETILEDTSPDSNSSQVLPPELKGNPAKLENNDLSEAQHLPQCTVENVLASKPRNGQADEANIIAYDAVKKDGWLHPDCDGDVVVSATPDLKVSGSCSSSYVHPSIQKKLMQVQNDVLFKQKSREADSNGHSENIMSSIKASDSCNQQPLPPTCADMDHMLDATRLEQLAKAKNMGILDLSPEDEVEGEMLYLQNRLIDNAAAIKHSCEDLIFRVVRKLPQELDALKKQRWDLVLVNQFLHEVREAKKRGRKERKHREAQSVLAAAAAAAAASSRNSLLRKDGNDEIISAHPESPLNISALSGRAAGHSPLGPRLKETSRSAVFKVSPDKHSEIFKMPEFSKENALSCEICRRAETLLNRIFVCSSCKVAVHLDCYRRLKDPIGPWNCELCEEMSQSRSPIDQTLDSRERSYLAAQCGLCGGGTGAFRKSTDGQWVHAFCAEWLLESTFRRGQQNLVDGMDSISKEKDLLTCCICYQKLGVCLKCSYGHCQIPFHPSCARSAGLYMNVKAVGGRLHHKAYCEKHSLEQRQKADSQQYGAEELKSIKQIRVELEKVRLLCERIIKREKLKRDLVLCSHDILASRRDYVAFSVLVQRSFFPPGVSSESATTSIDNKSYSGTIQRSEDITVDSTVSGKHNIRLSMDMDQKTDDSSTSQLSFKRKISDRTSFSGKQLPQRSASVSFRNSADDGEKRFKARKHSETFHKEVVMTSHQASMQNQRLPKGFAYVPVGSISKEKPVVHDSNSSEPREPGG